MYVCSIWDCFNYEGFLMESGHSSSIVSLVNRESLPNICPSPAVSLSGEEGIFCMQNMRCNIAVSHVWILGYKGQRKGLMICFRCQMLLPSQKIFIPSIMGHVFSRSFSHMSLVPCSVTWSLSKCQLVQNVAARLDTGINHPGKFCTSHPSVSTYNSKCYNFNHPELF